MSKTRRQVIQCSQKGSKQMKLCERSREVMKKSVASVRDTQLIETGWKEVALSFRVLHIQASKIWWEVIHRLTEVYLKGELLKRLWQMVDWTGKVVTKMQYFQGRREMVNPPFKIVPKRKFQECGGKIVNGAIKQFFAFRMLKGERKQSIRKVVNWLRKL